MAGKAAAAAEMVEAREDAAARVVARYRKRSRVDPMLGEAKTFAWAADQLLRTADQALAETRHGRKQTAELLDRLEARLALHG